MATVCVGFPHARSRHTRVEPVLARARGERARALRGRRARHLLRIPAGAERALGHAQPHRFRPHESPEGERSGSLVPGRGDQGSLCAVRHRVVGRSRAHVPRGARRCIPRGRDGRGSAHVPRALAEGRAGEGDGLAASQKQAGTGREGARGARSAPEGAPGNRLGRQRQRGQALSPPGRDRHAVLRHHRFRYRRRPFEGLRAGEAGVERHRHAPPPRYRRAGAAHGPGGCGAHPAGVRVCARIPVWTANCASLLRAVRS